MSAEQTLSNPVLVLVDHENNGDGKWSLTAASEAVVRRARELSSADVYALSLVPEPDTDALAAAGVQTVFVAEAEGFSPRVPAGITDAMIAAVERVGDLGAVFVVSTYRGRAVAAMLGVRLESGAAGDVGEVEVEGDHFVARKTALAGAWRTTFSVGGGVPVLAFRTGAGSTSDVTPGAAQVEALKFDLSRGAKDVVVDQSARIDGGARIGLNEADVAVVAGRGVDGDFDLVEELADLLGAAVGATRVACDEGWVGRSAQIGQTGLSIAPKLYVGLGVSGAVHHTCGMLASEKIVAVVDDPDAPIAELADFTVIGDVSEVVPAAIEELRARGADA